MEKALCNDWLLVCGDAHYTNDERWFTEHKNIENHSTVKAIGKVELSVLLPGCDSKTTVIVLQNVLYIPSALCNGIRISLNSFEIQNGAIVVMDESGKALFSGGSNGKGLIRLHLYDKRGVSLNETIQFASVYFTAKEATELFLTNQSSVFEKKQKTKMLINASKLE